MGALESLIRMLRSTDRELVCAAALVLGRLRPVEDRVVLALRRALPVADPATLSYFLDALAATRSPTIVQDVLPFLDTGGSIVEQAIRILHQLGRPAFTAMHRAHEGVQGFRSGAWIKAIAGIPVTGAVRMLMERLPEVDWEQARAISIFVTENFARYPAGAKESIRAEVRRILGDRDRSAYGANAVVTAIRLAGALPLGITDRRIAARLDPAEPPQVRRHALTTLGLRRPSARSRAALLPRLTPLLCERDEPNILAPLLELFEAWQAPALEPDLAMSLLGHRCEGVSALAVRSLAGHQDAAIIDALAAFLGVRSPRLRIAAARSLAASKAGRARLVRALFDEESELPGRTDLAIELSRIEGLLPEALVRRLTKGYVEAMVEGRRYDRTVLEFLVGQDRESFNRRLARAAGRLHAEGRSREAIRILQPLVRWRHADEEVRILLAAANLAVAATTRPDDPEFGRGVGLLVSLMHLQPARLAARLRAHLRLPADRLPALKEALTASGPAGTACAEAL